MGKLDLSLTVWAKTLTAKQRKALRQPHGKTPAEWLAIIKEMRGRGLLILSPQDTAGRSRGRLVVGADIRRWLKDKNKQAGFTFFAHLSADGRPVAPTKGFAVAVAGTVFKKKKSNLFSKLLIKLFVSAEREQERRRSRWQNWNNEIGPLWKEAGACVGGWFDPNTGAFEVNLTLVFWSQEEAERFGLQQDQKAIFRFVGFVVIEIGGSGKPRWKKPKSK